MGFLDYKERIFDISLTERGRQLLSKNQLQFSFYAFSDEGVDYSGSLSYVNYSGSIDNIVFRNIGMESHQEKDGKLGSFLFTVPNKQTKVPSFVSSEVSGTIAVHRYFASQDLSSLSTNISTFKNPIDIVVKADVQGADRQKFHVNMQNIDLVFDR